jgi:hypothetical protein
MQVLLLLQGGAGDAAGGEESFHAFSWRDYPTGISSLSNRVQP